MPEPGVPESFKVLIKELQSLCLDVKILNENDEEIEIGEDDDDIAETAKPILIRSKLLTSNKGLSPFL